MSWNKQEHLCFFIFSSKNGFLFLFFMICVDFVHSFCPLVATTLFLIDGAIFSLVVKVV